MWDSVPPGAKAKPPVVEQADAMQQALWSNSYTWETPIKKGADELFEKAPGGGWGYWPESAKQRIGGLSDSLDAPQLRQILRALNVSLGDLQKNSGSDLASRLVDVLDSQYDIYAPLSTGKPSYKRKVNPAIARALERLERSVENLREENEWLRARVDDAVPVSRVAPLLALLPPLRTKLQQMKSYTIAIRRATGGFRDELLHWAAGITKEFDKVKARASVREAFLKSVVNRLNHISQAAVALTGQSNAVFKPLGIHPFSTDADDPTGHPPDENAELLASISADIDKDAKPGGAPTIPYRLPRAKQLTADARDGLSVTHVEHLYLALTVLRVPAGIDCLAAKLHEKATQLTDMYRQLQAQKAANAELQRQAEAARDQLKAEKHKSDEAVSGLKHLVSTLTSKVRALEDEVQTLAEQKASSVEQSTSFPAVFDRIEGILEALSTTNSDTLQPSCRALVDLCARFGVGAGAGPPVEEAPSEKPSNSTPLKKAAKRFNQATDQSAGGVAGMWERMVAQAETRTERLEELRRQRNDRWEAIEMAKQPTEDAPAPQVAVLLPDTSFSLPPLLPHAAPQPSGKQPGGSAALLESPSSARRLSSLRKVATPLSPSARSSRMWLPLPGASDEEQRKRLPRFGHSLHALNAAFKRGFGVE
ncbi:hypothetical protein DIPPA_00180 [Diplonema papillatum]|nr:hypothetical protein DIPPA_00180 [Diplonema papillatum]